MLRLLGPIAPALYMHISICAHMCKHTPISACVNGGPVVGDEA